jgi:hypothetical protein
MEQQQTGGEQKIKEYINRIKNGEQKDKILEGLPLSFVNAIEKGLETYDKNKELNQNENFVIPPQYEGLDSETLDFIWVIPEYTDPEKTKTEKNRKSKILENLKLKEQKENKIEEQNISDQEDVEKIKKELGISKMENSSSVEQDKFSEFRMKNGETDQGFFWNEYRNAIAKELKNSGKFEWGKERIYFDVSIQDCEKLRNLAFKISSEQKIPIAFKYIDDEKTFPIHKDGNETRFVMNFVSSDDARRFYSFLSQSEEYKNLQNDRHLDYKGVRIDNLAEYASGFREKRGALERIMNAKINEDGKYEYLSESGKKMVLSENEFNGFKSQYQQLEDSINREKDLWNNIIQSNK